MCQRERRQVVHRQRELEAVVGERARAREDAGVVDEHVEPGARRTTSAAIARTSASRAKSPATGSNLRRSPRERVDRCPRLFGGAAVHQHARARLAEPPRRRPANPVGRAGHEDGLAAVAALARLAAPYPPPSAFSSGMQISRTVPRATSF